MQNSGMRVPYSPLAPGEEKLTEPEAVAILVVYAVTSGGIRIKDRKYRLRKYLQCAIGKEIVSWIVDNLKCNSREDAVLFGNKWLEHGFMRHVCSDHVFKDEHLFYRFIDVPELTLTYVEAMKEKAIATVRERLHEPYNRTESRSRTGIQLSKDNEMMDLRDLLQDDTPVLDLTSSSLTPRLLAANLRHIVLHLCNPYFKPDFGFRNVFFLTYRAYASPEEVFHQFESIFKNATTVTDDQIQPEIYENEEVGEVHLTQIRLLNLLRYWVQAHYSDFKSDRDMSALLSDFLERASSEFGALTKEICRIRDLQENHIIDEPVEVLKLFDSIKKRQTIDLASTFDDIPAADIAEQIALLDSIIFNQIDPVELLWYVRGHKDKARNTCLCIEYFNHLGMLVRSEVLCRLSLTKRVQVIEKWIEIACILKELSQFNSLKAVLSGLKCASVKRLRQTWSEVSQEWRNREEELVQLTNFTDAYKKLRKATREAPPPVTPYVGLYLSDLTFMSEGSSTKLANNFINLRKFYLMGGSLREIQEFQLTRTDIAPKEKILQYILSTVKYDDDNDCFQESLRIEPKDIKEGVERMLVERQTLIVQNETLQSEIEKLELGINVERRIVDKLRAETAFMNSLILRLFDSEEGRAFLEKQPEDVQAQVESRMVRLRGVSGSRRLSTS